MASRKAPSPATKREADELRARIKTLEGAKLYASAKALRRKLRALVGEYELSDER